MAARTVASKGHSSTHAAAQKRQSSAPYVFRNSRVGSAAGPRPVAVAAAATPQGSPLPRYLEGRRRWNWQLWRRLARAPEAVSGRPVGRPLPLGVHGRPTLQGAPSGGAGAEPRHGQ